MLYSHMVDCSVQSDGDRRNVLYMRRENLLRTSMVMMVVMVVAAMAMVMSKTVMMLVTVPTKMMMPVDSASSL